LKLVETKTNTKCANAWTRSGDLLTTAVTLQSGEGEDRGEQERRLSSGDCKSKARMQGGGVLPLVAPGGGKIQKSKITLDGRNRVSLKMQAEERKEPIGYCTVVT